MGLEAQEANDILSSMSLEMIISLPDNMAALYFSAIRWDNELHCPDCGNDNIKLTSEGFFKCRNKHCRRQFNHRTGTIFALSHYSHQKCLTLIELFRREQKFSAIPTDCKMSKESYYSYRQEWMHYEGFITSYISQSRMGSNRQAEKAKKLEKPIAEFLLSDNRYKKIGFPTVLKQFSKHDPRIVSLAYGNVATKTKADIEGILNA